MTDMHIFRRVSRHNYHTSSSATIPDDPAFEDTFSTLRASHEVRVTADRFSSFRRGKARDRKDETISALTHFG